MDCRAPVALCDLRGNVHTWYDELQAAGVTAERWFARWRPLSAVLRWLLVGKSSDMVFGPGAHGAPEHTLLTGYVARELGEESVARKRLARAAAHFGRRSTTARSARSRPRRSRKPGSSAWRPTRVSDHDAHRPPGRPPSARLDRHAPNNHPQGAPPVP